MKICFIAPASSSHIVKLCHWFRERGHEVHVISFIDAEIQGIKVHFIDTGISAKDSDSKKLKYLLFGNRIKRIVKKVKPDIVNVHYATSYGAAVALSGMNGYVLSVWGSDIFDFPLKSVFHKALVKFSLSKAKYVFSTSQAMAEEAKKYTDKHIYITPFGVDMDLFNPNKRTRTYGSFVIGSIKALEYVYGIDILLKAVGELKRERPDIHFEVRIAGKGKQKTSLEELSAKLSIKDDVTWLGFISQDRVAVEWANMDLAVIPSRKESFGVSSIEAQASGTPVIYSDISGLKETTISIEDKNAFKAGDYKALKDVIIYLYDHKEYRNELSLKGRDMVAEKFEMNTCFQHIETLFTSYSQKS